MQIAVSPATEHARWALYALCNDGTIWCLTQDAGWCRIEDIPREKELYDRDD